MREHLNLNHSTRLQLLCLRRYLLCQETIRRTYFSANYNSKLHCYALTFTNDNRIKTHQRRIYKITYSLLDEFTIMLSINIQITAWSRHQRINNNIYALIRMHILGWYQGGPWFDLYQMCVCIEERTRHFCLNRLSNFTFVCLHRIGCNQNSKSGQQAEQHVHSFQFMTTSTVNYMHYIFV